MKEEWKQYRNTDYWVSNLGRIKSFKSGTPKILKPSYNTRRYYIVSLDGKTKRLHRLIMEAFHGSSRLDVNHKNGIKTDNRLENLEYVTKSENNKHAYATGLNPGVRGSSHGASKLTEVDVRNIKERLKLKEECKAIAKILDVHPSAISKIKRGVNWGWL